MIELGLCQVIVKKAAGGSEIPTPQFLVVDSYEKDYTPTFKQPQSYIRARPGIVNDWLGLQHSAPPGIFLVELVSCIWIDFSWY